MWTEQSSFDNNHTSPLLDEYVFNDENIYTMKKSYLILMFKLNMEMHSYHISYDVIEMQSAGQSQLLCGCFEQSRFHQLSQSAHGRWLVNDAAR